MTEVLVFLLVVGNYGLGLRRDGLPLGPLIGAAAGTYWAVRLGGGAAFVAIGESLGRHPTLLSEATMAAIGPAAALCAYAVVRLVERRALERLEAAERAAAPLDRLVAGEPDAPAAGGGGRAPGAAPAGTAGTEPSAAPARAAVDEAPAARDPYPLLPPPGRSPRPRLSPREEWALALGLAAAGLVILGHTVATARPYWRDDLTDPARQALKRRADEALRLETRLLDCARPEATRDLATYDRLLDETARAGLLRVGSRPATAAAVRAQLEQERAARCASTPPRPGEPDQRSK